MLQRANLKNIILSALNDYPDIAERYLVGDPTVTAMLNAVQELGIALSADNDINIIEPFIKSKDRTIIADAINKGILPIASPCQFTLTIENDSRDSISLSQGRVIEDGTGRQWRLLSAITIAAGSSQTVICEQSTVSITTVTIQNSEPFYRLTLPTVEDVYIAGVTVKNKTTNTVFSYAPKFMNALAGDTVYTIFSDDFKSLVVMLGDSERIGQTVQAGDTYEITITQSYGYVDINGLKQASLEQIYSENETYLNLYFKYGGLVRSGAYPLSVSQLRLLASYPSTYDQNAVFMGNFDMLVRSHFMSRFGYMAIWNETTHEKFYGASVDNINRLNLAVVANDPAEQATLVNDIRLLVAKADSLLEGRVRTMSVTERPYQVTINAVLSGVHDTENVKTQITELLLSKYGKGTISASHPNADGFNRQEIATLIRTNIPAFQDRISDFTVIGEDASNNKIKPHEWLYVSRDSIHINISRTADAGNSLWTLGAL